MSSIQSQQWQFLSTTLSTARGGTAVVLHGSDIVIIGGEDNPNTGHRAADVNIIDTNTGQCYVGGQLAFGVSYAPSIIVDNILFVFGGYSNSAEKRYQYATMPTLMQTNTAPTSYPTGNPSESTTNVSSENPTNIPSQYPITIAPSIDPTILTLVPTIHTLAPTLHSSNPTNTFTPSQFATGTPSFHPMAATSESSQSTDTIISSKDNIYSTKGRGDKINPESESVDWILMALIAVIVSLLCICAIVLFFVIGSVQRRDKSALSKRAHVEAHTNADTLENTRTQLHKVASLSGEIEFNHNNDREDADECDNDDECIIAGVNTMGGDVSYNNDHVVAGGNTLGEGDVPDPPLHPPNNINAMGFLHAVSEDEIIVGDDETNLGATVK
eukprot:455180_1